MHNILVRVAGFGQIAAMIVIVGAALFALTTTFLCFIGYLPWLELSISFGGAPVAWAGMAFQIGLAILLGSMLFFLPSAVRVLQLENAHRRFEINMDDVTNAYRAAHMADRKEVFDMRREFDAVRERYQYLKDDPTLAEMDAELLTIAAQMSQQSQELAETFSDAKVSRAKEALKQRNADADALQASIKQAYAKSLDLRRMIESVEYNETLVAVQLVELRNEVMDLDRAKKVRVAQEDNFPCLASV